MRRVVAIVAAIALVVVGILEGPKLVSLVFAPTCEGSSKLEFADGSTVALCGLTSSTFADGGHPRLELSADLPGRGPYGAGTELARFGATVFDFGGRNTGIGSVDVRPDPFSIVRASVVDWMGSCRATSDDGPVVISCDLDPDPRGTGKGRDGLAIRAEIPGLADPRTDPRFRWLDVTYAVTGGYTASGTAQVVLDANTREQWGTAGFRLPGDDMLILMAYPGKPMSARIAIAPGDSSLETPRPDGRPIYHGDVEFSGCAASFGAEAFTGRLSCSGGQYVPPTGDSPVSLEVSWRPAP